MQPPDVLDVDLNDPSALSESSRSRAWPGWRGFVPRSRATLVLFLLTLTALWLIATANASSAAAGAAENVRVFGTLILLCAAGAVIVTSRNFARYGVGRATPGTLGAIRAYVCLIAAVMTFLERTGSLPALPDSDRRPGGVIDFLYGPLGLSAIAHSHLALAALKAATITVLLAAAVGFKTRITLPLGAILWLVLAGVVRSYLRFTHNGLIPFYMIVALCFMPCADGLSIDRLLHLWRGQPVPRADRKRARYAWARLVLWIVLALPYAMAGMSKLRFGGWTWWEPANMQQILVRGAFRPHDRPYDWVLLMLNFPPAFFAFMGICTLITEGGMGLVPFWRPARRVIPMMTVGMHVAIYLLQRIRFWDMMVLLAIYYDWTPLRRWIGRRVSAAWGTLNVTFDPANARQVRAARVLADVNWLDLLNFTPAATPRIRFERRRMQHRELVDRALVRSAALPAPREMKRPGRRIPAFAAPIAAVGVIAIVLGWWSMRVEWFPFTSMRMYADYNNSGVVEYYRVFQIDSAGVARPAHLEKMSRQAGVFHLTLWQAFANDRMQQRCVHLLQFCGREWNAKAPPSERVAAMEIRKYRWNFRRDRNDPNRGRVVDALAVSIAPAPSALKHTRGELVTLSDVATSNDLRLKNPPRCQLP